MSEHEHKQVKIFIDQQSYHSPTPVTGAALHELGKVEPGLELFREVTGDREDPEIPNGQDVIHFKEDEHFHSGKPKVYHIIVNGRKRPSPRRRSPTMKSSSWRFRTRSPGRTLSTPWATRTARTRTPRAA